MKASTLCYSNGCNIIICNRAIPRNPFMAEILAFGTGIPPKSGRIQRTDFLYPQDREGGFQIWHLQDRSSTPGAAQENCNHQPQPLPGSPQPRKTAHIHHPPAADRILSPPPTPSAETCLEERRNLHPAAIRGESKAIREDPFEEECEKGSFCSGN